MKCLATGTFTTLASMSTPTDCDTIKIPTPWMSPFFSLQTSYLLAEHKSKDALVSSSLLCCHPCQTHTSAHLNWIRPLPPSLWVPFSAAIWAHSFRFQTRFLYFTARSHICLWCEQLHLQFRCHPLSREMIQPGVTGCSYCTTWCSIFSGIGFGFDFSDNEALFTGVDYQPSAQPGRPVVFCWGFHLIALQG